MIKKQVSWQVEKFTFSADMSKNQQYRQLREEVKSLLANGWEVLSQEVAGYDATSGDMYVLIGLVKYEYVDEPASQANVKEVAAKRGRPAKSED